jgi:hypothetical protein
MILRLHRAGTTDDMQRRQIDLETFLEGLSEEDAANARAAAACIDEIEHAAQRIGQSDRKFLKLFALAGITTLIAAFLALGGYHMFQGGQAHLADVVILLMASAFPVLVLVYSLKMNERTKLDRKKFEIIEAYFLPHDAIYLPAGPDRPAPVVAVTEKPGGWERPPEVKIKKPGRYW